MEGSNNINKKQMIDLKLIEPKLIARNRDQRGCQKLKTSYLLYGKIPLIRPTDKSDEPTFEGRGGAYIQEGLTFRGLHYVERVC